MISQSEEPDDWDTDLRREKELYIRRESDAILIMRQMIILIRTSGTVLPTRSKDWKDRKDRKDQ